MHASLRRRYQLGELHHHLQELPGRQPIRAALQASASQCEGKNNKNKIIIAITIIFNIISIFFKVVSFIAIFVLSTFIVGFFLI